MEERKKKNLYIMFIFMKLGDVEALKLVEGNAKIIISFLFHKLPTKMTPDSLDTPSNTETDSSAELYKTIISNNSHNKGV